MRPTPRNQRKRILKSQLQHNSQPLQQKQEQDQQLPNSNVINTSMESQKQPITELQSYSSVYRRNISINFTVVNKCNSELMDFRENIHTE
ncbi:Hypothetical predicted protein [Octopus vulgaris]|uniref:Uncharacterized protein n=1 Tax=Octopus vulgaris TaxID=6645 RepID=A0AA36EZF5_OCTVU|nr:Hypothetical predicted protein [Octopus vulgaris]